MTLTTSLRIFVVDKLNENENKGVRLILDIRREGRGQENGTMLISQIYWKYTYIQHASDNVASVHTG